MMKRKTIAWVLLLLLMLSALSGCKQANETETAAPGDAVEKPETEPTEQDTPVAVDPVEEKKEEQEEKIEESADEEQGEKQEETAPSQTPAGEETAEKETTGEESAPEEFDKEAWLEEYLVEANEIYDAMEKEHQVYFEFEIILKDYPGYHECKESLSVLPDFSCVESYSVYEDSFNKKLDVGFEKRWTRRILIEPKDKSREGMIQGLKALTSLDYVQKVTVRRYYIGVGPMESAS